MKTSLILLFTALMAGHSIGQVATKRTKHVESFFQLGGVHTSFQDTKFSSVRYNGNGTGIDIGRKVETGTHTFMYGFEMSYSTSKSSTFSLSPLFGKIAIAREFCPSLYLKYMKQVNDNLSVGGRLDVLDSYFRVTEGLLNNKFYYNVGTNLYFRSSYHRELNDQWRIETGIELGILSFMGESTSFAFTTSQTALEQGQFNYQDEAIGNPFGFKYYELRPIWKYANINMYTDLKFRKRWTLSYQWGLRRFSTVRDYPTTIGIHTLGIRFDFIDKVKERKLRNQK